MEQCPCIVRVCAVLGCGDPGSDLLNIFSRPAAKLPSWGGVSQPVTAPGHQPPVSTGSRNPASVHIHTTLIHVTHT